MWKQSLLKFAREEYNKREELSGSVASISPTPYDLMQQVLQDSIFGAMVSHDNDLLMFVDLGCGDGRWLEQILDHKFNFNCMCFGVEIDNERIELAKIRCSNAITSSSSVPLSKFKRFEIIKSDIRHYPLSLMNVIIVYLSIKGNELIKEKIYNECPKGSIIIAVGFAIKESSSLLLHKQYESSSGLKLYIYNCVA